MPALPSIHLGEALRALASIRQPKRLDEPPLLSPRNVKRHLLLNNGEAEVLLDKLEELDLVSGKDRKGRRLMFRSTWLHHRPAEHQDSRAA